MGSSGSMGSPRFSCLFRGIFLIIGVPSLLLAAVGYIGLSGRAAFSNNRLGTGRIIEMKDATAGCPDYVAEFSTDNGQRVTFETQLCSGAEVGQSVQVMYDPLNPTLMPMVVDLSRSTWYRVTGYAAAGVIFTLLGLLPLRAKPSAVRSSANA